MAEKRKDNRGRILRDGEDQKKNGRYRYRYKSADGKRHAVYSWKLVPTDRTPAGRRDCRSLREKENDISQDSDGIDGKTAAHVTLNDMFDTYMSGKRELKQSTRTNYLYMYANYVRDVIGGRKIVERQIIIPCGNAVAANLNFQQHKDGYESVLQNAAHFFLC